MKGESGGVMSVLLIWRVWKLLRGDAGRGYQLGVGVFLNRKLSKPLTSVQAHVAHVIQPTQGLRKSILCRSKSNPFFL